MLCLITASTNLSRLLSAFKVKRPDSLLKEIKREL
jgi:hypothetical protein